MRLNELASLNGDAGVAEPERFGYEPGMYASLEGMARFKAAVAASTLIECAEEGMIDLEAARDIVDFGAGTGGPTYALALMAEENGGHVDAVEPDEPRGREIERVGMTRHMDVDLHLAEGLRWLAHRSMEGKRYDLITAFMFGPDEDGAFSRRFLDVAQYTLAANGRILLNSDANTVAAARQVCEARRIYEYSHMFTAKSDTETLVVPKLRPEVRLYAPAVA